VIFVQALKNINNRRDELMMQLNELLKIYKEVFSLKNGYERISGLHKVVLVLLILAGGMGAAIFISTIFFPKYFLITVGIYLLFCLIISKVVQKILKCKYNDVHYLEKKSNAEFIERISLTLNLDFRDDKVLNAIEEYLNFHLKKEKNKVSFLTLFKPGITWVAFIIPILLSYLVNETDLHVIQFVISSSVYIIAISLVIQAVNMELNNYSKHNLIMGVLEILSDQKIINLRRNLAVDEISTLLSTGNFKNLSKETLIEAGYSNIIEQNMSQYISLLYSIKQDIDREKLQDAINNCNQSIKKNKSGKYNRI
jgi:hypothetical protein